MADADHSRTPAGAPARGRRATSPNRKKSPPRETADTPITLRPKPSPRPRGRPSKKDFPYTVLAKRLEDHAATLKPLPPLRPRSARRPETCTVAYTHYEARRDEPADIRIPALRLSGKWLEEIGFGIGAKVRVEVEAGVLKLTVVSPEPSDSAAQSKH